MAENQTTSTWLLSLIDTGTAIHLVRDLINRTFSLGTMTGVSSQIRVFPNVPTFTLYHVGPEKQLDLVPLEDPSLGIPLNRIHIISGAAGQCKHRVLQPILRKSQDHHHQQQQHQIIIPTTAQPSAPVASSHARYDGNFHASLNSFASTNLVPSGANCIPADPVYNQLLQG